MRERPARSVEEASSELLTLRPILIAIATSYVGALADDAADEAIARAVARWCTYDQTRPLQPWVAQITRNVCIEMLRRADTAGRNLHLVAETAVVDFVDELVVDEALASLTTRDAAAVRLVTLEGHPHAAAAQQLNMTAEGVRSAIRRAKAKLSVTLAGVFAAFNHRGSGERIAAAVLAATAVAAVDLASSRVHDLQREPGHVARTPSTTQPLTDTRSLPMTPIVEYLPSPPELSRSTPPAVDTPPPPAPEPETPATPPDVDIKVGDESRVWTHDEEDPPLWCLHNHGALPVLEGNTCVDAP